MVNEDKSVRSTLAEALGMVGYAVLEPCSASQESLETVDSHRSLTKLLVRELMMPRMKGLGVAERLIRRRSDTLVRVLSRVPEDAVTYRRVKEVGIFLAKPFSLSRFIAKVCAALVIPLRSRGNARG